MSERHYCSRCGQCCRVSGAWYEPLRQPGTDVCKYFEEPGTCSIYDTRPIICDTEAMFDIMEEYVDRARLLGLHKAICKEMEKAPAKADVIEKIYARKTRKIRKHLIKINAEKKYFEGFKPGGKNETVNDRIEKPGSP